ncbi:DUF3107 domain-containing protein [Gephyromycinifex aptenodytis]|uniref:DUF3107 domain-containing protein n=1 Tax=Gephyromycinifex aptenodytis TaxID=2716227 RepID=UPI001447DF54|nr:DUF3107 domain-containing protein [Gephyromycinifex aptenodytis]
MEVKIGVQHVSREISLETDAAAQEVEEAVEKALSSGSALRLMDSKGNLSIVPAASIAYVEIGAAKKGGVGFGML